MKYILIIFSFIAVAAFISCTNYGKKVSKDNLEIFYKDGISKEEAQKTLDFLYPTWNKGVRKSIQLAKISDTITFRMVSDEKKMSEIDDETFYMTGSDLSNNLFNSAPVNVDLTDDHFKTIRTYHFQENYSKKVTKDNIEIYYKDGISKEEAQKMLDFLYPTWNEGVRKSVQLAKISDTITFRMVTDEKKMGQVDDETFYLMGSVFSDSLFNSAPVNVDLTDNLFKTIRTYHFKKIDY